MTPHAALTELLAHVGAAKDATVLISEDDLRQWPKAAVAAMKSQKMLVRARPTVSVVCPGCEQECVMPVHTPRRPDGSVAPFIVCDKRSDINRVPVPAERLAQWRCDADAVCGFVVASLGLRGSETHAADTGLLNIGMAAGDNRRQMLCLKADGALALVAGNASAVPLTELVNYRNGTYSLDAAAIRQLVDSATAADPRYTPSNARREVRKRGTQEMYHSWQKAYRALKKRRPNMSDVWYSQQIAKQDIAAGRDAETIRKHMKK